MEAPQRLDILVDGAGSGAWNMAVDHALMERARSGAACVRLYGWDPPCLSLGRNQPARGRYPRDPSDRHGADVVRRPTGGRAVYHHREVTYAVVAPLRLWGGLRESYRRINAALARGLRALGVPVDVQGRRGRDRSPGPSTRACFRDPLPGELVVRGRKLVGSAQWRNGGALLQHGSILLDDDQARAEELRMGGRGEGSGAREGPGGRPAGPEAAALTGCLEELPSRGRLEDALCGGFIRELELEGRELPDSAEVFGRAQDLLDRYRAEEWTWRR